MKRIFSAVAVLALAICATLVPASAQVFGQSAVQDSLCSYNVAVGYPTPCTRTIGDKYAYSAATTSAAQVIALTSGASIRISMAQYEAYESATGGDFELEYGTGTNCATGATVFAKLAYVPATTTVYGVAGTGANAVFIVPAGKEVCVLLSAGTVTSASVGLTYSVY